jgi:hypothetical protein
MSIDFPCPNCHGVLRAQEEFVGLTTRCPRCDGACLVPDPAQPAAAADAAVTTARALGDAPWPPGATACPSCGAALAAGAVLCVGCGFDQRLGRRRRTRRKRLDLRWTAGPSLLTRCLQFGVSICLLLLALLLSLAAAPQWPPLVVVAPLTALLLLALLVLSLGGVSSFRVYRTAEGKLRLEEMRYICFIPRGFRDVSFGRFEAVEIVYTELFGFTRMYVPENPRSPWTAQPFGEEFTTSVGSCRVALRGKRERETLVVYRGPEGDYMRAIIDALQDLSGLPVERGK